MDLFYKEASLCAEAKRRCRTQESIGFLQLSVHGFMDS